MSALESLIATGGEAAMIDSLDFTLPPASTAVVDRRQHVRAYPTSASTLTPNGTRTVRIRLGGDDFVDASSIRIMYTINNLDATYPIEPDVGPWGMWNQVYLRSNGVELDNIPAYGRFHQQYGFNQLPWEQQWGEASICGFGGSYYPDSGNNVSMGQIAPGASYTAMHKLHLSLFNSGKLLPTRYAPLEVEMTLAPNTDWLIMGPQPPQAYVGPSTSYTISNIQIVYDAFALDEAVQESFYKALLSNRALSIPTMTVFQTVQSIPGGSTSFSFSAVRAFSRLSHVWLTFKNSTGKRSNTFSCPTTIVGNQGRQPLLSDGYCPSARLSIGPHYWPDPQPASSFAEFFYMFQKAIPNIPNINRDDFENEYFTMVFDVRKVPEDPTSSISTRSGALLNVQLTNLSQNVATECWMTLFAFSVTAVRESGVTLLT